MQDVAAAATRRPRVTVGLPLYNGADYLEGCLDCLAAQTFGDFTALAIDNGSTDATADILAARAARDPRLVVRRNPATKPVVENFLDLLAAADTEYFLWRAYDDYTSDNFLAEQVALLDAHPAAELAVAKVVSLKPRRGTTRTVRYPALTGAAALDVPWMMFRSHASWFYCLWRTEALRAVMQRCWAAYGEPWAVDHLVLFDVIVRRRVVGSNAATFFQRVVDRPYKQPPEGAREAAERVRKLAGMRQAFRAYCEAAAADAGLDPLAGAAVRRLLPAYVSKRVYRARRLRRLSRRAGAGLAPTGAAE